MSWISNYITIGTGNNAYTLPAPTAYEVQRADLDSENTTRNEAGYLSRDRIRGGVYKIVAKFRVKVSDLQAIISHISGVSFTCTFLDLTTASYQTKTMYCGDRSASLVVGGSATNDLYVDLSVNFIEL